MRHEAFITHESGAINIPSAMQLCELWATTPHRHNDTSAKSQSQAMMAARPDGGEVKILWAVLLDFIETYDGVDIENEIICHRNLWQIDD